MKNLSLLTAVGIAALTAIPSVAIAQQKTLYVAGYGGSFDGRARLLDAQGQPLPPGGAALAQLAQLHLDGLDPHLARVTVEVACDVDHPLCGPRGSSAVFAPQKGADAEAVALLDAALAHWGALGRTAGSGHRPPGGRVAWRGRGGRHGRSRTGGVCRPPAPWHRLGDGRSRL